MGKFYCSGKILDNVKYLTNYFGDQSVQTLVNPFFNKAVA